MEQEKSRQEILNEKYKDILIPTYIEDEGEYVVNINGRVETGSFSYLASFFCMDGVLYHYNDEDYVEHPNHAHSFEEVLEAVLDCPESFSIENYLEEYSEQERRYLYKFRDKILEVKKG